MWSLKLYTEDSALPRLDNEMRASIIVHVMQCFHTQRDAILWYFFPPHGCMVSLHC